MRWLWIVLACLLLALQYRLWLGENSLAQLWHVNKQIAAQAASNEVLQARNDALKAEVRDLKQGLDAIEERARNELGMIKQQETFYQLIGKPSAQDDGND